MAHHSSEHTCRVCDVRDLPVAFTTAVAVCICSSASWHKLMLTCMCTFKIVYPAALVTSCPTNYSPAYVHMYYFNDRMHIRIRMHIVYSEDAYLRCPYLGHPSSAPSSQLYRGAARFSLHYHHHHHLFALVAINKGTIKLHHCLSVP